MSISWSSWPPISLRYPLLRPPPRARTRSLATRCSMPGTPASTASPRGSSRARCEHHPHRSSPDHLMGAVRARRTRRSGNTVSSGPPSWIGRWGRKHGWWREAFATVGSTPQLHHLRSGAARYALSHVTRSITPQPLTVLSSGRSSARSDQPNPAAFMRSERGANRCHLRHWRPAS